MDPLLFYRWPITLNSGKQCKYNWMTTFLFLKIVLSTISPIRSFKFSTYLSRPFVFVSILIPRKLNVSLSMNDTDPYPHSAKEGVIADYEAWHPPSPFTIIRKPFIIMTCQSLYRNVAAHIGVVESQSKALEPKMSDFCNKFNMYGKSGRQNIRKLNENNFFFLTS